MRVVSVDNKDMFLVQGKSSSSSSSSSASSTPKAARKEPLKEQTSFLGKIGQMVKNKLTSSSSSSSSVDEESRVQGEFGSYLLGRVGAYLRYST